MNEKISVIVPVYNAEKTLDRCVQSLQAQTYSNIEILLVNDGSKDSSLEICSRYAREDARIRLVDKPNGGVSSARNAGLDAATGEFVMFCDSDDWAEPEWCACLHEHYIPENLTVCEINREDVPKQQHPVVEEIVERKKYLHHPMLMCSPVNKFFCRKVIEEKGLRFSRELSLGEDFVFCLQYLCAVAGKVRFVYRGLYNYDTSDESSLSGRAPSIEQCEAFYQAVTAAMNQLGALDEKSFQNRDTFVSSHFERNLRQVAQCEEKPFAEKISHGFRMRKMEGFRNTCRRGIRWGNPVYVWILRNGWTGLAMLFLLLSDRIKRK